MTMKKHSKEYAEKLAEKNYHPKEGRPYHFVKGYLKAIEEINHVELLEKAKHILHLHMCEQEGISSGQPTPDQWYKAVTELDKAINKAEQFDEDK